MARHYVCGICGKNVATFSSWRDVQPSDLLALLEDELQTHDVNTEELDGSLVLSRFRIVDDDEGTERPAGETDDGMWAGQ